MSCRTALAGLWLGCGVGFSGCASQQATGQAMTVAGAAAVVVGASLAADNPCSEAFENGQSAVYCSQGSSRGLRRAGTAVAIAGAGVAAAGYALQSKGPDRTLRGDPNALPQPATPYRLVRPPSAAPAPAQSLPTHPSPEAGQQPPCVEPTDLITTSEPAPDGANTKPCAADTEAPASAPVPTDAAKPDAPAVDRTDTP